MAVVLTFSPCSIYDTYFFVLTVGDKISPLSLLREGGAGEGGDK
jgi:hypothetical protein